MGIKVEIINLCFFLLYYFLEVGVVTGLSERAKVYSFGDQSDLHRCMQMRRAGTTARTAGRSISRGHWRELDADIDLLLGQPQILICHALEMDAVKAIGALHNSNNRKTAATLLGQWSPTHTV